MTDSDYNRCLASVNLPSQAKTSVRHRVLKKGWLNVTKKPDDSPKATLLVCIVILVVILGWSACAAFWAVDLFRHWNEPFNPGKAGLFGDTFGAVNALFSGLALVGVAVAVVLQRQELHATKKGEEKNDEARAKSDLLMERQAQALLAAAKLNATRAIWETTDANNKTHIRIGNTVYNTSTRDIYRQQIKVILHEISCYSGPTTKNQQQNNPTHTSYLGSLAHDYFEKLNTKSTPHMESFRRNLSSFINELALLSHLYGIHDTTALGILDKTHVELDTLLRGSGAGSQNDGDLEHFLNTTRQIVFSLKAHIEDN